METPATPVVATNGNVIQVTGLASLPYSSGTLKHYAKKVGIGKGSTCIVPWLPSREGYAQLARRSPQEVTEWLRAFFQPWLDGVEPENCVFVVPAAPAAVRAALVGAVGGGLTDEPQHVHLRKLFCELFPEAHVYGCVDSPESVEQMDMTDCLQKLLHHPDLLSRPGRHHIVVPRFVSRQLVASMPADVSPKDATIVYVADNHHFYNLGNDPRVLAPYEVLPESTEIKLGDRAFPPQAVWTPLNQDGVPLNTTALCPSLSQGVLRMTSTDIHTIVGIFPLGCKAADWLPTSEEDSHGNATTRPWSEAMGAQAANVASLVDKSQRVSAFLAETFGEDVVNTSDATRSEPSSSEVTPAAAPEPLRRARRIRDLIAGQLRLQVQTAVRDATANMVPATVPLRLPGPPPMAVRDGAGGRYGMMLQHPSMRAASMG